MPRLLGDLAEHVHELQEALGQLVEDGGAGRILALVLAAEVRVGAAAQARVVADVARTPRQALGEEAGDEERGVGRRAQQHRALEARGLERARVHERERRLVEARLAPGQPLAARERGQQVHQVALGELPTSKPAGAPGP